MSSHNSWKTRPSQKKGWMLASTSGNEYTSPNPGVFSGFQANQAREVGIKDSSQYNTRRKNEMLHLMLSAPQLTFRFQRNHVFAPATPSLYTSEGLAHPACSGNEAEEGQRALLASLALAHPCWVYVHVQVLKLIASNLSSYMRTQVENSQADCFLKHVRIEPDKTHKSCCLFSRQGHHCQELNNERNNSEQIVYIATVLCQPVWSPRNSLQAENHVF
eukprot:6492790-Amphidinium_carterae.2